MAQDYSYSLYTPIDNTGSSYNAFKSAYKNVSFTLQLMTERPLTDAESANLPGLSFNTYGVVDFWRILLAYNGLQDPIQDVYAGLNFKFPTKASIVSWLTQQQINSSITRLI